MPDEWETARGLDPNDPEDRNHVESGEVYTNLERYLNALASDEPYLLPPVNLEAILDDQGHAGLSWTDISTNETGFIIERKDGNEGSYLTLDTVPGNVTVYTDTFAIRSDTITYRMYAYNHDLNSIPSGSISLVDAFSTPDAKNIRIADRQVPDPLNHGQNRSNATENLTSMFRKE